MTYREQVKKSALQALLKCQLAFDSLVYILHAKDACNLEVIKVYDIFNRLHMYRDFLNEYRRDAFLDFTETHIFENCIEIAEELTAEMELYNEYLFGEKRYISPIIARYADVGYVYAPYVPIYINNPTSQQVMATTRKLKARWSVEAEEDLKSMHNIDFVLPLESDILLIPGRIRHEDS